MAVLRNFSTKTILGFLAAISIFLTSFTQVQAQKDILEREMSLKYTLMPMFLPKAPDSLIYEDLLWAMTRDQGYEAHCASMEWYLDKDLFGAISKFFSEDVPPMQSFYNGLNPTRFHNEDVPYVADLTRARIPMMRGLDSRWDLMKNSSLEGMFGVDQPKADGSYSLNSSGVAQNLLTTYQQCLAKTQNFLASSQICDESAGEVVTEECTLNKPWSFEIIANNLDGSSRKITDPNQKDNLLKDELGNPIETVEKVSFYTNALRGWFAAIRPDLHGKELYEQVCYDITAANPTEATETYTPPPVEPKEIAKLREAMDVVAIDLDSLYRLAFLVISPQQNKGKEDDDDKFHWLQAESIQQIDSVAHAPIFIAFKIPDFGTNKSRIAGNIDSLELTKMVLQTKEQNDKDLADQTKRREQIYEAAKRASELEVDEKVMNCPSFYPQCKRRDENALNNVIEDMINGIRLRCNNDTLRIIEKSTDESGEPISVSGFSFNEKQATASGIEMIFNQEDLNWENAGDLFTPANKDIKVNDYRSPVNTHIANWQLSDRVNQNFPQGLFDWELMIDVPLNELEEKAKGAMKVNAYLILPMGETIKDANKALSIFWREEDFFEMIRTNVIEDMITESGKSKMGAIPKHYPIKDAVIGFADSKSISPRDECVWEDRKDANGFDYLERVCKNYQFGVGFTDNAGQLLFPDFGLGFMVRKIQQVLRTTYDASYNYIRSCQRVEDMFLGRCSGDPEGELDTQSFCDGTAFKNIKGIPGANSVPTEAVNVFRSAIAPLLTPDLIEAYQYAQEQTGIPCEVVAGIHWTEAGLNPAGSVFSGGAFSGSLKENAKQAMEHLIWYWPGKFDPTNIPYEELVAAIGIFNGPGNMNCSSDPLGNIRPTRWREGGQCPAQFQSEDHPHAVAWISGRHDNMDLIYCMDFAEFSCQTSGTAEELKKVADYIREWMATVAEGDRWTEARIQSHAQEVGQKCFAGSPICQSFSSGDKYPRYDRPGSLTTAILINDAGGNR